MDLTKKHCIPCEGGTRPFSRKKAEEYLKMTRDWKLLASQVFDPEAQTRRGETLQIQRKFVFKVFKEALAFLNNIGRLAESENHHPDIYIHNYKKVDITLSTHLIGGLSVIDFVMAAKINQL